MTRPESVRMAVLAVCGWSGAGKTTLIEAALPRLGAAGLRVAAVKHDAHGVQLDHPGKDSDRLFRAGADVVLRGPGETAWRRHRREDERIEEVIRQCCRESDLVLVEGHKATPLPKLWCRGPDEGPPPAELEGVLDVLAPDGDRTDRLVAWAREIAEQAVHGRPLYGGLLAGGRSRRMGRPKQLMQYRGRSFAEAAVTALGHDVGSMVVLGDAEMPPAASALPRLPDAFGLHGPLAGIVAATRWAPEAAWVIAAGDLPKVDRHALGWLLGQRRAGIWAVVPRTRDGHLHPLFAVYEPQAGPLLEALVATGQSAPRRIAQHPKVATPEVPNVLEGAWTNVNTPEEWRRLSR